MAEEKQATEKKAKKRISSAQKRDKQGEKRRLANRGFKSKVKTAVRSYETALTGSDQAVIQTQFNQVCSLMDKGVKTGCFKVNKAARTKSRLSSRMKSAV